MLILIKGIAPEICICFWLFMLPEGEVGKSEKRMAIFVRMFLTFSLGCICVCKAGEQEQSHWAEAMEKKHRADGVERKSDDGKDSAAETQTSNWIRRSPKESNRN